MKSAPLSITCQTHGWDTETEQDVELPSVYLTIWVKAGGSTGKALERECKTPEELWGLVRALNKDRARVLKETFNYIEPERKDGLPKDLGDLFG